MGGYNSGRTGWRAKCERLLSIDVRRWSRGGYLSSLGSFGWQWTINERKCSIGVSVHSRSVELRYTKDGEAYAYTVRLDSTPCHFGGWRLWFVCPSTRCGRRVAKLFLGKQYFACRRCYNLAYQSQCYSAFDRSLQQAGKIRRRLSGGEALADPFPEKPKRMHWRTYARLRERCERYEEIANSRLLLALARLGCKRL